MANVIACRGEPRQTNPAIRVVGAVENMTKNIIRPTRGDSKAKKETETRHQ